MCPEECHAEYDFRGVPVQSGVHGTGSHGPVRRVCRGHVQKRVRFGGVHELCGRSVSARAGGDFGDFVHDMRRRHVLKRNLCRVHGLPGRVQGAAWDDDVC